MKLLTIALALLTLLSCSSRYTLTDFSGRKVTVEDVSIGNENELFGLIGNSEITIPLENIRTLTIDATYKRVYKNMVLYKAQLTFLDGVSPEATTDPSDSTSIVQDSDLYIEISPIIIGATDVGVIQLPLKSLRSIEIVEETPVAQDSTEKKEPETSIDSTETPVEAPTPNAETGTTNTP